MYSAPYGFANAAPGPGFNGGAAPPPQNPHMQPGPMPNQPQQMMYNPQQFPMGAQGPFPGGPNMMPGAGPGGMPQNAMPHMGANGQMSYQTPYAGSPYGAGVPVSSAGQPQMPPNFNMMANAVPGYGMNPAAMTPQQQQQMMQQRMHSSQQAAGNMNVSTPQRQFSGNQGTPNNAMSQPQQFPTPQNSQATPQNQTPASAPQPNPNVSTPQTPTFPSNGPGPAVNGASSTATPLSPGSESKEKEVFGVILEINQELLYESIQLQTTQQELKKEHAAANPSEGTTPDQAKKPSDEEKTVQQDYVQCMRRLQFNLSYLASLADRKGSVPVPKGPAYLTPPPLNLSIKMKNQVPAPESGDSKPDPNMDREERIKYLGSLYKKLQALYPDVDPKKEPAFPIPAQGTGSAQKAAGNQASPSAGGQKAPQTTTAAPSQPAAVAT